MNCNFYTKDSWITKKCPQKVMGTFVNRLKKVFRHPQFIISATSCSQLKCTPTFSRNILSETTINHPYFLLDFLILMYLYVHALCPSRAYKKSCTIKKMLVCRQSGFDPGFSAHKVLISYHSDFCDICHNSHWASK